MRASPRPWIANTFLVILACVFSVCGGNLHDALDVRDRGAMLAKDMSRYASAPCTDPRASAPQVDALLSRRSRFRPFVACTYVVDGVPHEATTEFTLIDHYRSSYGALLAAQRWVAAHTPLTAYYDPFAPAYSTLSREVRYSVTSEIVFSIGGIAIALGMWFAIVRKIYLWIRAWRRRRRDPEEPIPSARVV